MMLMGPYLISVCGGRLRAHASTTAARAALAEIRAVSSWRHVVRELVWAGYRRVGIRGGGWAGREVVRLGGEFVACRQGAAAGAR